MARSPDLTASDFSPMGLPKTKGEPSPTTWKQYHKTLITAMEPLFVKPKMGNIKNYVGFSKKISEALEFLFHCNQRRSNKNYPVFKLLIDL